MLVGSRRNAVGTDNKTAEIADWNYNLLPIERSQLTEMDFDLSHSSSRRLRS